MLEKGEAMTLLKKNTQKLKVLNKQERQQFGIKKKAKVSSHLLYRIVTKNKEERCTIAVGTEPVPARSASKSG
jgi:hypothetical protein